MATVTGLSMLRLLTNNTGVSVGITSSLGGTVTLTTGADLSRRLVVNSNGGDGDVAWLEITFPSNENFSLEGLFAIGLNANTGPNLARTKANNGIVARLYSETNEYREWVIGGSDSDIGFLFGVWRPLIINPRNTGSFTTAGFNLATVNRFRLQITKLVAVTFRLDFRNMMRVNPLVMTGSAGIFEDFLTYTNSIDILNLIINKPKDGESFFLFRAPILIGDGSTSTNFSDFARGIAFAYEPPSQNPQVLFYSPGDIGLAINNATTTLRNNLMLLAGQAHFEVSGAAPVTIAGGVIQRARETSTGGASVTRVIFDDGGPVVYSASTTYTASTISGKAIGLYIGPSFDTETIELSVFNFESNTVNVQVDTAFVTLNLSAAQFAQYNIDPDNFPISTIGGGSVTVTGPVATTTFTGFPTSNNANGVAPAPVIGFYSSASAAGFIAALDTSDPEYSAGSFTVLLSDYPGVTHVVGDAVGWIRTDYIPVDGDNPPSSVSLAAAFREIVSETGMALVGNGTVDGKAKLTYDQANTRFDVAAGPITFADALDKKEELTSNVAGLENFETGTVRGIQFISSKYGNEILLPSPLTIAASATAATSPILEDFLVVRAGDPTADPFEHGLTSTAPGLTDRPEVRMLSTLFISGSSGGGATIDAQDVADALKLAPTAGTPATGSVYAELDSLLAGTGGTLSYDLPQFIALLRADAAFKRALSEGALITGLGDELALVKTQVWTRADVRTAWNMLITNAGVTNPSVGEVAAWNGYAALLPGLSFAANGDVSYAG